MAVKSCERVGSCNVDRNGSITFDYKLSRRIFKIFCFLCILLFRILKIATIIWFFAMDECEYFNLKKDASNILGEKFAKFIDKNIDDDKHLYELREYINDVKTNKCSWSIEKAQIVLSVMQLKNHNDIQEILSYLEQSSYGWQEDEYCFYNRCLGFDQRCRRRCYINKETTEEAFSDIDDIFLHKEYGAITTYLFGYGLAALFSSRIKKMHGGIC